jgi:hypothetical protein
MAGSVTQVDNNIAQESFILQNILVKIIRTFRMKLANMLKESAKIFSVTGRVSKLWALLIIEDANK